MHTIRYWLYTLAILVLLTPQPSPAQHPLTAADRSVIAFDLQVNRLIQEMKTERILTNERLERLKRLDWPVRGMQLGDFQSISWAIGLPGDPFEINRLGQKQPRPINGFIRLVCSSADAGKKFQLLNPQASSSRVLTPGDGSTVYLSEYEHDLSFRKISDTEFEFLTDKFLNNPQQRNFKTAVLANSWNALPEKPLRIAIDTTDEAKLTAIMMQVQPMSPAVDIFKELSNTNKLSNTNSLSLAIGFENEHVLELFASSSSESQAENFQGFVNGLLFLARSQGGAWLKKPPSIRR